MTSRFSRSYICFNGPKQGDYVDAPPGIAVGSACALPWFNAKHLIQYAVYVVTEHAPEDGSEPVTGLMFLQSHATPEHAQAHVHRITTVMRAAHETTQQTS